MKRLILAGVVLLALVAAPAVAEDFSAIIAAEAAGQVGERYDGFLGTVVGPGETVRRQVATINIRRRALYADLAGRRGVTPQEVGITAGCALLGRVAIGEAYLLTGEGWRRRAPGQPAPHPDYCR